MAILKCKMCGGDLEITEGMTVCECEYCGSKQTVPTIDDEKKITLFSRANRLRAACEFDKAAGVYESIVAEFQEEAEAYWGLVLCKYGIEYVDDPKTGKKIPTCHRSSFNSVLEDSDFEMVMEYSDALSRSVYREEAKIIEGLRVGIIEVSSKEEPYDIFICYKETDANGERTIDSVIAQDVYSELTEKGYRVFFSRITLEDTLGQEYEPYIFAALNSAKVMLAFGTDYEYYNAVWVKNEWSRFLNLIEAGHKKTLIPCYKDIDTYDMPVEFKKLQGQDMGKVGAVQDLLRGVEKIIPKMNSSISSTTFSGTNSDSVVPLLERVEIFLSDRDWEKADEYCEKILDIDPKNAQAYLRKMLVEFKTINLEALTEVREKIVLESANYNKVVKFADDGLKQRVEAIAEIQKKKVYEERELKKNTEVYEKAEALFEKARTEKDYTAIISLYEQIKGFRDSDEKLLTCKNAGSEIIYKSAMKKYTKANGNKVRLAKVADLFETISEYKDSQEIANQCRKMIADIEVKEANIENEASEVFRQYSAFLAAKSLAEKENQLSQEEKNLLTIESDIRKLEERIGTIASIFENIDELKCRINNIQKEKDKLTERKRTLGFFAGKEKKAIDEQIHSLDDQERAVLNEIDKLKISVNPYNSCDDVQKDLISMEARKKSITGSISRLKEEISLGKSIEVWNEEKVYEHLLDMTILYTLWKRSDVVGKLKSDERVTSYIEKNPITNPFSAAEETTHQEFNMDMSFEDMYSLEKLNYWEQPKDRRDEEELLDEIEDMLSSAELLDDYEIEREVCPEVFNANIVMKKHGECYENGTHYDNGDTFDVNHYGKPASFVIKDFDGNVKLLIMLGKEQSFTYWLVKWAKLWCKDNNVPILCLHVGLPNTEHYIMRRVYEKLGLIDQSYNRRTRNPMTGEWMDLD